MKPYLLCAMLVFAAGCMGTANPDLAAPANAVLRPVNAAIAAATTDNASALSALYTRDAVVVDDQQPFEWSGANAGSDWLSDVSEWGKWSPKVAHFKGTPVNIEMSGKNDAYVVAAGVFSSADRRKPWTQRGTLTFTLRNVGEGWKIASQVWTRSVASR